MLLREVLIISSAACLAASINGGPLDNQKIAKNAKWVVHLDFDSFRSSKVGNYLTEHVLQPKLEAAENSKKLNLSINFRNIASITAYGPDFEKNGEGVLLIETTANVKNDLDALVGLAALSGADDKQVKITQQEPYLLYSLDDELYAAPGVANTVILAKSKEQIANAREVLLGKAANLSTSKAFAEFPQTKRSAFFVGMAEGLGESPHIPPQAKVLKETTGGRILLGENAGALFVSVTFRGKDMQSCTNVSQVLQGLVALVRITQQDEDVTTLANSAQIGTENQNVTVNFQIPVSKAISKINEREALEK
jgi:hypothetical protein